MVEIVICCNWLECKKWIFNLLKENLVLLMTRYLILIKIEGLFTKILYYVMSGQYLKGRNKNG